MESISRLIRAPCSAPRAFTFGRLPQEIRDQVYRDLLRKMEIRVSYNEKDGTATYSADTSTVAAFCALSSTCKEIRQEMHNHLVSNITDRTTLLYDGVGLCGTYKPLPTHLASLFRRCRHLEVVFPFTMQARSPHYQQEILAPIWILYKFEREGKIWCLEKTLCRGEQWMFDQQRMRYANRWAACGIAVALLSVLAIYILACCWRSRVRMLAYTWVFLAAFALWYDRVTFRHLERMLSAHLPDKADQTIGIAEAVSERLLDDLSSASDSLDDAVWAAIAVSVAVTSWARFGGPWRIRSGLRLRKAGWWSRIKSEDRWDWEEKNRR